LDIVDILFEIRLFILITLVYSAELLTDFSYTNFTVSCTDALDRLCSVEHCLVSTKISYVSVDFSGACVKEVGSRKLQFHDGQLKVSDRPDIGAHNSIVPQNGGFSAASFVFWEGFFQQEKHF